MPKLNQRGQLAVASIAIAAVVVFVILSIGLAITQNVYAATGQTPTFSGLWATAVAGVAILAIIIAVFAFVRQ